jgi:1-acyl-sn-glycerol-3-phosphate acyltransferase
MAQTPARPDLHEPVAPAVVAPAVAALPAEAPTTDLGGFRERSLTRGVNPVIYWALRALFIPFFLVYFRLQRIGREQLPRTGPLLMAANHRSFLDPFVIGTLVRRPVYYMAKRELFEKRWQAWILNALGAFPVDRGAGDRDAMETARVILERGDCVVVFPEGTRVRPGPLGDPRRGVGRLSLETARPWRPWRSSAARMCAAAGASARARCASASGGRCCSPPWSSAARPRWPRASRSACGRA